MLAGAIVLFVVAAVFGLMNLIPILKNKPAPKPSVFIHGGFAALGLLCVILAVARATGPSPVDALILFVIAALGGFVLFGIDMQKKPMPKWLAILHPLIAAVGLVLLIVFVVGTH